MPNKLLFTIYGLKVQNRRCCVYLWCCFYGYPSNRLGLRITGNSLGRHVYAVGDDPEAAELSGVNVKRTLITVYATAGLICGFAGWALLGE